MGRRRAGYALLLFGPLLLFHGKTLPFIYFKF